MPQQHNKKMKIEIEKILSDMLLIKFEFLWKPKIVIKKWFYYKRIK
jgi:hypothetical protein